MNNKANAPSLPPQLEPVAEVLEWEHFPCRMAGNNVLLTDWPKGLVAFEAVEGRNEVFVSGRWAPMLSLELYGNALEVCNGWNISRTLPKAFIVPPIEEGTGECGMYGGMVFTLSSSGANNHDTIMSALNAMNELFDYYTEHLPNAGTT